jgi:alcohol dehydrogenase
MLVRLPAGADLVGLASAGDNMANGYRAVAPYLANHPGAPVLVRGGRSASIGLYAVFFAVALGSEKVVYWDDDRERLGLAQALSATVTEGPVTTRERFAIGVNASGTAKGLCDTLGALAPAGVCTTTFPYDAAKVELPLLEMFAKGLTLVTGGENSAVHLEAMLTLIAERQLDPGGVVTRVAVWDDAAEALLEPTPKLVITRQRRDQP